MRNHADPDPKPCYWCCKTSRNCQEKVDLVLDQQFGIQTGIFLEKLVAKFVTFYLATHAVPDFWIIKVMYKPKTRGPVFWLAFLKGYDADLRHG